MKKKKKATTKSLVKAFNTLGNKLTRNIAARLSNKKLELFYFFPFIAIYNSVLLTAIKLCVFCRRTLI